MYAVLSFSLPCAGLVPRATDLGFDTSMDVCLFVQNLHQRKTEMFRNEGLLILQGGFASDLLGVMAPWTMFLEPPRFGLHCGVFYFQATDSSRPTPHPRACARAQAHVEFNGNRSSPTEKVAAGRTAPQAPHIRHSSLFSREQTMAASCLSDLPSRSLGLTFSFCSFASVTLRACWSTVNLMASAAALVLR